MSSVLSLCPLEEWEFWRIVELSGNKETYYNLTKLVILKYLLNPIHHKQDNQNVRDSCVWWTKIDVRWDLDIESIYSL